MITGTLKYILYCQWMLIHAVTWIWIIFIHWVHIPHLPRQHSDLDQTLQFSLPTTIYFVWCLLKLISQYTMNEKTNEKYPILYNEKVCCTRTGFWLGKCSICRCSSNGEMLAWNIGKTMTASHDVHVNVRFFPRPPISLSKRCHNRQALNSSRDSSTDDWNSSPDMYLCCTWDRAYDRFQHVEHGARRLSWSELCVDTGLCLTVHVNELLHGRRRHYPECFAVIDVNCGTNVLHALVNTSSNHGLIN